MANLGQAALIVVGTVVGAYFGNPQLGFVLGALAGSELFPTQLPSGPKIGDNRTTTSSIGDPVAEVYGTADVAGTVMWLAPYVETQNSSGKGGPSQTTYSYNQSIAIGLCRGPIAGVSRIWENGAIVYDIRPQLAADPDLNRLAETDTAYANRLTVSAAYAETFTLYLGDATNVPDPTIEAVEGVGTVPAFNELAYIVYPNRALQTNQAWRHPNFKFEIYTAGAGDCIDTTVYSAGKLFPWETGSADPRYVPALSSDPNDPTKASSTGNFFTYQYQVEDAAVMPPPLRYDLASAVADSPTPLQSFIYGWTLAASGGQPLAPGQFHAITWNDPDRVWLDFSHFSPGQKFYGDLDSYMHGATNGWCNWVAANVGNWWVGTLVDDGLAGNYSVPFYIQGIGETNYGSSNCLAPDGTGYSVITVNDRHVAVVRYPGPPDPICKGLTVTTAPGLSSTYAVNAAGKLVDCLPWQFDRSESYLVMRTYANLRTFPDAPAGAVGAEYFASIYGDIGQAPVYPVDPARPVSSADNNDAFWTAQYLAAVQAGAMPPGLILGSDYPQSQPYGWKAPQKVCTGGGGQVSLAQIIAAICTRAGYAPAQFDVSDLAAIFVDGYSVSSQSTGAAMITPLRSVGFFDSVETNSVLKFVRRGKPSVATFTTDDFGAFEDSGKGKTVPPSMTVVRTQDEELPRMIRLRYKATALDYQDSEQLSPYRVQSAAVNDIDVSLPICLSDTFALQCAEVLWADAWEARVAYTLSVDQAWLALDVGDCIDVPVDGILERMRIVSDSNAAVVLRKLSCVRDNGDAYISTAVAQPIEQPGQVLTLLPPTAYELLDLPALQDADSDAGFYVAVQRASGAGWKGAVVYQSIDAGVSFVQRLALTTETQVGTIAAAVPASQTFTWDMTTTITVNVPAYFSFESITDAAILAGHNGAAMGADGRWEVVQFATATQVSPTQWHLTRLLRGRRGTEHVCGSSTAGDAFVLLTAGALGRVVLQQAQVGASLEYKGATIGAAFSSGTNQTFAGHGRALVPFSPVDLSATRQANGDLTLAWVRRGRLGRTLMSGTDIPLSEATEAYQVDILSVSTPPSVLRTLNVTTQSATYSVAQQQADFNAPLTSLSIAVYQLSAIVGRGTPATALLTFPLTAS